MSDITVPGTRPADGRFLPVDHLRTFVTMLVVVHHAVLAYHPYGPKLAPFTQPPLMWRAFPVLDPAKWTGSDLVVAFNETFFMPLMFLIGGLFVWTSIAARGTGGFFRERALRLGVPFVVGIAVLSPLAYYTAFRQSGGTAFGDFVTAWLSLGVWPSGPAWFLWVLLAFAGLVALAMRFAPRAFDAFTARIATFAARPGRFFFVFAVSAIVVYVPMSIWLDGLSWAEFGPFTIQRARTLLYLLWFVMGIGLGRAGVGTIFARDGAYASQWVRWQVIAPFAFFVYLAAVIMLFVTLDKTGTVGLGLITLVSTLFAFTGVVTGLAMLTTFARFAHFGGAVWRSLHRHAYGIFLLHYAIVAWLQYALLPMAWPAYAKGITVIVGGIVLSWLASIVIHRLPGVSRVI